MPAERIYHDVWRCKGVDGIDHMVCAGLLLFRFLGSFAGGQNPSHVTFQPTDGTRPANQSAGIVLSANIRGQDKPAEAGETVRYENAKLFQIEFHCGLGGDREGPTDDGGVAHP